MNKGPTKFPLTAAHLTGIGAFQASIILAFFSIPHALIPLGIFIVLCYTAPFLIRFSFFLPIISRGKTVGNNISVTFDDGPCPKITPALLDLLAKHGIKATFFVTGENAEQYMDLINRIITEGHTIGNHSFSHSPFLMLKSSRKLHKDIETAQEVLARAGISPVAFRPPVGITNPRLWKVLLDLGMYCINFSCRANDQGNRRIKNLSKKILKKARANDIIMLHDIVPGNISDTDYLLNEFDNIFSGLVQKGLKVIPLSDLIRKPVMFPFETGSQKNPARSFYNCISTDYDNESFNSPASIATRKEFELFSKHLPDIISPSDRILEIGAGTGIYSIPLSRQCRELTAIDISEGMIEILKSKAAKENISNIIFKVGDIEGINLGSNYDAVFSFSSFEYIPDLVPLLKKISDSLNPGGILYFITAHSSIFRFFTQIGNALRQGIWLHARSKGCIKRQLKAAGFENIVTSTHLFKFFINRGMLLEVYARKMSS